MFPFVVYRISAPAVAVEIDTDTGSSEVVESGENVGVATVPAGTRLNTAPTVLFALIDTVHVDEVPEHAPDHPANVDPLFAAAVSVTEVPDTNC